MLSNVLLTLLKIFNKAHKHACACGKIGNLFANLLHFALFLCLLVALFHVFGGNACCKFAWNKSCGKNCQTVATTNDVHAFALQGFFVANLRHFQSGNWLDFCKGVVVVCKLHKLANKWSWAKCK